MEKKVTIKISVSEDFIIQGSDILRLIKKHSVDYSALDKIEIVLNKNGKPYKINWIKNN